MPKIKKTNKSKDLLFFWIKKVLKEKLSKINYQWDLYKICNCIIIMLLLKKNGDCQNLLVLKMLIKCLLILDYMLVGWLLVLVLVCMKMFILILVKENNLEKKFLSFNLFKKNWLELWVMFRLVLVWWFDWLNWVRIKKLVLEN